jgi:hypothetical protein
VHSSQRSCLSYDWNILAFSAMLPVVFYLFLSGSRNVHIEDSVRILPPVHGILCTVYHWNSDLGM